MWTSKQNATPLKAALVACVLTGFAAMNGATAQEAYPAPGKIVSIIVGATAGSGQDVTARLVADAFERQFPGSRFQIINKPGAGTQLAYQAIADAPKDGYTFGILSLPNFATLYLDKERKAQFDRKSFKPIANFIFDPGAIAVPATSSYKTLQDLITAAKAKPKQLTIAVGSPRGREHLDVSAVEQASGASFTPVFHNDSGAALNTLLGGNVDAQQGSVGDFLSQIAAGRLRLLAVFAKEKSPFVPDVPTAESAGYPIYSGVTRGFTFPAGVSDDITKKLSDALGKIVSAPAQEEKIKSLGFQKLYMPADEIAKFTETEEDRIKKILVQLPQ
jgi:tripartite-type tricarboxylate transporter receptor subunit TctC